MRAIAFLIFAGVIAYFGMQALTSGLGSITKHYAQLEANTHG